MQVQKKSIAIFLASIGITFLVACSGSSGSPAAIANQGLGTGPTCGDGLLLSAPMTVAVGQAVNFSETVPSCMTGVAEFNWIFGDNATDVTTTSSTSHVYSAAGMYIENVFITASDANYILTNTIFVTDNSSPTPPASTPEIGCPAGKFDNCTVPGAGISGAGTCQNGSAGSCTAQCHTSFNAGVSQSYWNITSTCGQ